MIERMTRDRDRPRRSRSTTTALGGDRLSRRRRTARRADDARAAGGFSGGESRQRRRRSTWPSGRPGASSRTRCSTRSLHATRRRRCATIEEASDAGTDLQVLIRSLIAAFRNLLVARIDPEPARARSRARGRPAGGAASAEVSASDDRARAADASATRSRWRAAGGNARLELETALLRFILAGEDPTLDALAARVALEEEETAPAAARVRAHKLEPRGRSEHRWRGSRSAPQRARRDDNLAATRARRLAEHPRQGRKRAAVACARRSRARSIEAVDSNADRRSSFRDELECRRAARSRDAHRSGDRRRARRAVESHATRRRQRARTKAAAPRRRRCPDALFNYANERIPKKP